MPPSQRTPAGPKPRPKGKPKPAPVTPVSAGVYLKQRHTERKAERTAARREARGGRKVTVGGVEVPSLSRARNILRGGGNPRRWLVAELVTCLVILGASTVVAPTGAGKGVPRLMIKGSGLMLLFLLLALVAAGGRGAARAAGALGALVTAAYLFTSPDATAIVTWLKFTFGPSPTAVTGAGAAAGAAAGAGGAAGPPPPVSEAT